MRNYKKSRHLMLDIETLDTKPSAVVLSIGAATADFSDGLKFLNSYEWGLDTESQFDVGRTSSKSTVDWWGSMENARAREHIEALHKHKTLAALLDLSTMIHGFAPDYVWCQGASFDFPILTSLYRNQGMDPPWKFYHERDSRTMLGGHDVDYRQKVRSELGDTLQHGARSDAEVQLRALYALVNEPIDA